MPRTLMVQGLKILDHQWIIHGDPSLSGLFPLSPSMPHCTVRGLLRLTIDKDQESSPFLSKSDDQGSLGCFHEEELLEYVRPQGLNLALNSMLLDT